MKKIVNRSNSRPTGKYRSWKMNRMMQWKTVAHLNVFRLLDADSRVSSFQELYDHRLRTHNNRQMRRWLEDPEFDPVFEASHRHDANYSWW